MGEGLKSQAARSTKPSTETEAQFSSWVEDALKLNNWTFVHFRTAINQRGKYITAMSGTRGFPDYVIVRAERVEFWELKQDGKYPTSEQYAWHDALTAAGQVVRVYRPRDRDDILEVLK